MSWFLFKRYFFSQRAGSIIRTLSWISVAAVSVGVASLILVLSVMNGFNDSIRKKLLGAEPHVIAFTPNGFSEAPEYLKDAEVLSYHRFEQQDVILKTNDGLFAGAVARGVEEDHLVSYLEGLKPHRSVGMSQAELLGQKIKPGEIVVGSDLARSLGIYEGDQLIVIPPDYLLMPPSEIPNMDRVGVHALFLSEVPEIDSRMIFYVKDKTLQSFKRAASLESGWEVKLKDPNQSDLWAKKMLLQQGSYSTWQQRNSALFFALKMEKSIMAFFLGICILITSFSVISVLILFITQKKTEIGVLMSLGFSRAAIQRLLMRFGVFLSSLGLGGGLIVGLTITLILQKYPLKLLPTDVYYDSSLPAKLDWLQVGYVALGCVVLGVFCSLISSKSRVLASPADAFRLGK
jgi:lipoprotein-releasing system permease protein